jgi:hypothetical protein
MSTQSLPLLIIVTVVVLVNPSFDLPAMVEWALWRRPDRQHGVAAALDPTPLVTGCCLLDHKAQLGGVVKSIVDFLLRVFGVHATPTLGNGVTVVNMWWEKR